MQDGAPFWKWMRPVNSFRPSSQDPPPAADSMAAGKVARPNTKMAPIIKGRPIGIIFSLPILLPPFSLNP